VSTVARAQIVLWVGNDACGVIFSPQNGFGSTTPFTSLPACGMKAFMSNADEELRAIARAQHGVVGDREAAG
jgi:hypothetical protein